MQRLSATPFGQRAVSAGLLATQALADAPAPAGSVDKWQVFRDLTTAQSAFSISSRALTVLNALLSFHPEDTLSGDGPIIVFPSNQALAARAHGMAETTLRRHLAALCGAGLLLRHDSPNGKRYAARDRSGALTVAFGFDLRPLLCRAAEIAAAARAADDAAEALRRQREALMLKMRDCEKLMIYIAAELEADLTEADLVYLAELRRMLRRKPDREMLGQLSERLEVYHTQLLDKIDECSRSKKMSGNDALSERHYHSSKPETLESEPCLEKQWVDSDPSPRQSTLPLSLVLKACPQLAVYADKEINDWESLYRTVCRVVPWLGISGDAWSEAISTMGSANAAVTVAAILERQDRIRAPGGYLRSLTDKAHADAFTPGPMIMALLQGGSNDAAVRS